jgi:hypothetical protein
VVFHEGFDLNVSAHGRPLDERELDAMLDERFEDGLGVASDHCDLDAWVVFEESSDEARQEILADGLRGRDSEASGGVSCGCGDGFACFFGERSEFIGVGKQGLASCGQGDPAATAIEEGDGELRFEGLDLLGDCGLGEQEFFGGLTEVQVPGDNAEDAEAEIFHSDQTTESLR